MTFLKGIGLREAVALIVLVIGLVLGIAFCNPDSTGGTPEPREISRPTVTPLEGVAWLITWLEGPDPEQGNVAGQEQRDTLDLAYEAGPFPDVRDDAWSVVATTTLTAEPGRYWMSLSYKGEIHLAINGEERGVTPSPGEGTHVIPIDQPADGPPTTIVLRLRDVGGPARLSATIGR